MSAIRSKNSKRGLLLYNKVTYKSLSLFLQSLALRRGGLSSTAMAAIMLSEMASCNLMPAMKPHTVGLLCPTFCLNALWNASEAFQMVVSSAHQHQGACTYVPCGRRIPGTPVPPCSGHALTFPSQLMVYCPCCRDNHDTDCFGLSPGSNESSAEVGGTEKEQITV